MAYSLSAPPRLLIPNGQIDDPNQGLAIWGYTSPKDSQATVAIAGYFSNGKLLNMQVGDVIYVYDVTNSVTSIYQIISFTGNAPNLSAISGGGGGAETIVVINAGGTTTLSALTPGKPINYIVTTNSAVTISLPAPNSTSPSGRVNVTADTTLPNITITPASGLISGQASIAIATAETSISLFDNGTNYNIQ